MNPKRNGNCARDRLGPGDPLVDTMPRRRFPRAPGWTYRSSFFGGTVGLCPIPDMCREPEHGPADLDDPGLDAASALLEVALPRRFAEFPAIVAMVNPVTHRQISPDTLSSNSGGSTCDPPGVYLTVTRPPATAEALVHEMAHHKLFALGVTPEAGGLFLEVDGTLAFSAAVGRDRPIPALLHAAYSFLHMLEFNLACRRMGLYREETEALLPGNLRVVRDTISQLQRHARPTPEGMLFFDMFYRWAKALCDETAL